MVEAAHTQCSKNIPYIVTQCLYFLQVEGIRDTLVVSVARDNLLTYVGIINPQSPSRQLSRCQFKQLQLGEVVNLIRVYCMKPPNIKAPKCTLFSRVKGHKCSPVLPWLIASIVGGSLLWRAHFESLRVAEAKNAATINRLMSKRQSVLYFPYSILFSRVKGHKRSPVLPLLIASIVGGSLLRRAHFESLRAAEAKNTATINQLKYRSRSCITGNITLGAWSRASKALGCASCFIGS